MVRRHTPTNPRAASTTVKIGLVPSRSSSHQPNAANSTGMAANSNACASASPKPRLSSRRSAQRFSRCPSAPGCTATTTLFELVNIITMYPPPRGGVKSGVSPEGRAAGQRPGSASGPRPLPLLTAGGEVDDVLAERRRMVALLHRGIASRAHTGVEHDVENEPERRHSDGNE